MFCKICKEYNLNRTEEFYWLADNLYNPIICNQLQNTDFNIEKVSDVEEEILLNSQGT